MYYLFNLSIEALGAARAGVLLYIQTIFIAVLAYLILAEQLQPYHLEGAVLIIAGLLLINTLKQKNKAETAKARKRRPDSAAKRAASYAKNTQFAPSLAHTKKGEKRHLCGKSGAAATFNRDGLASVPLLAV